MIRLAIRVASDQAELVLAELLVLAPAGVEESEPEPGVAEYAVYGTAGELPTLPELEAVVGGALVEVSSSEIADDWDERWKCFHRPVLIEAPSASSAAAVPAVHVRPPWEDAAPGREVLDVVIDPAQAFGTGSHATTKLCLGLMLELLAGGAEPGPLLDVGTGSGVLAIVAARLGFQPVLALDNDRESVRAAAANALVNEVEIDVRRLDLRNDPLPRPESAPGAAAPTVVANLLRPLLLELAGSLRGSAKPAHLVAGGLLCHELDEVAAAFAERAGLRERARRSEGEWGALWLAR